MLCDGYTALGQSPVAYVLGLKARFRHSVPIRGSGINRCRREDVQHHFRQDLRSTIGKDGEAMGGLVGDA